MPRVTMPDGTEVDMPEQLTAEQTQRLRALVAQQHANPKSDEETPPERDMKGEAVFGAQNVNKGIAGALGAPVDLAQDVVNLGKAAVGTGAIAMGRPDLAPIPREDAIGGSKWFENLMKQHKMISDTANPRSTPEKIAAAALQAGGNALGTAAGLSAAMKAASKVEALIKRPPASGIIKAEEPAAETARELRKEGYAFTPSQVNPTVANKIIEGTGGKVKTAQDVSIHNQEIHDLLARKALGVSQNTPLTEKTLDAVKNDAYAVYDKVRGVDKVFPLDTEYERGVKKLNNEFATLEGKFPGLTKSEDVDDLKKMLLNDNAMKSGLTPGEAIDLTRLLRKKATANFKVATNAMGGDPEKLAIAQAQREAANIVEDLISRNLSDKKRLYGDWVDARKQLAIAHDVESALNPDTGHVDARAIAALAKNNRPLSGPLEKVAKYARSFSRGAQSPEKIGGVPQSVMDMLLSVAGAGVGGMTAGTEGAMAGSALGAGVRPAARSLILSDLYQDNMVVPKKRAP